VTELPTARDYLKSNVRLIIWCKACRHQIEMEFRKIVEGEGDVPVVKLRFRCENCGSRLTDCVVSGSHLRPTRSAGPAA
jgi:Zn finger protein HypA/HybF involved in hydrogenase expression